MNKSICVVGAGYWGKNHIKTLHGLNSLGGVVELNENIIQSLANKYPEIQLHGSVEDAILQNYDGYIIATPVITHYEIAKKVIKAGKNLLIEKPLALLVDEASELVSLAKENDINAMVGHVLLFHPAIIKIKTMIENGDIGDLQYIYSNRLNLGKVRTEENVFWSLAPHDIAIFQYIIGSIPEKISANGSSFLQKGIPDSTITQLEYKNGLKGHIFVSWLHPFKEHRLVVIGSEAMISFEDSLDENRLKYYSKKFNLESGIPEKIDGPVRTISFDKKMPLEIELEYFVSHLEEKKPKIASIQNGLEVVKILVEANNQILT